MSACALRECTAGPFDELSILDCIYVLSIFFPISPPRASISLTRCPFELPPTLGLHGIIATLSILTVNIIVLRPSLALARAASHPACPAPTITTSYSSSKTGILLSSYFPIQKSLNILSARSSLAVSPMISPRCSYASIISIEKKSSSIPISMLSITFSRAFFVQTSSFL